MRAVQLLPIGSLAFRANLASALAAAAAACVLYLIAWGLQPEVQRSIASRYPAPIKQMPASARAAFALTAAWVFALSGSVWMQAVRAEVYALQALLAFGLIHQLLAWQRGDAAGLRRAALLFGLGLANHHLLMILLGSVAVLWVLWRPARNQIWSAAPYSLLGLSVLAYIPIRAAREPLVNWGAATTLDRFAWLVSAQAFQGTVDRVMTEPFGDRLRNTLFQPAGQLGIVVSVLAIGGLWLLLRQPRLRAAGILLLAAAVANLVGPLLVGFDPFNPDAHGYVLTALGMTALWLSAAFATALAVLAHNRPKTAVWATRLSPLLLLIGVWQGARHYREVDLSGAYGAEWFARQMLEATPTGGVLITHDFRSVFNLWYMIGAEGMRPDVRHVHAGFLGFPGYSTPERVAGAHDPEATFEYHESLTDELLQHLSPAGLVLNKQGSLARHAERRAALDKHLDSLPHDRQTDRARLWSHFQMAKYLCRTKQPTVAKAEIEAARRYSSSPMLDKLCTGQ